MYCEGIVSGFIFESSCYITKATNFRLVALTEKHEITTKPKEYKSGIGNGVWPNRQNLLTFYFCYLNTMLLLREYPNKQKTKKILLSNTTTKNINGKITQSKTKEH